MQKLLYGLKESFLFCFVEGYFVFNVWKNIYKIMVKRSVQILYFLNNLESANNGQQKEKCLQLEKIWVIRLL